MPDSDSVIYDGPPGDPASLKKVGHGSLRSRLIATLAAVGIVTWTSVLFAVLQSVCTFFVALGTLRLLVGATFLVAVSQVGEFWDRFHSDAIRVPMMGLALAGVITSLISFLRRRRLRHRPASQWRQRRLTGREVAVERVQIALQLLTVMLLVVEELMHLRTFHHL